MLQEALKLHFGHQTFRPGQEAVIQLLLSGTNTLAILPTGGGKSLCFQLPSILLPGLTVVISPLLALMKDQVDKVIANGQRALRYDSTLETTGKEQCLKALQSNEVDLLYISPESFAANEIYLLLKQIPISLISVDEAHCYSEWGHSFRPAYLHLPKLIKAIKPNAILALTATATKKVASEIRNAFSIKLTHQISTSFFRPNLTYTVIPSLPEERLQRLSQLLREGQQGPCIVYAMRQIDTMEITAYLQAQGITARSYHAGMDTASRERVQSDFLHNKVRVIVATIAFGMGIDKADVRQVIHYHLPKSPEGWMQESGRAGRDNQPASCTLLACGDDIRQLRSFIHSRSVEPSTLNSILRSILSSNKIWFCSPYMLGVQHDLHSGIIGILLLHLEQLKLIKHKATSWRYLKIRKLRFGATITGLSKRQTQIVEKLCALNQRYDTYTAEEQLSISRTQLLKIAKELEQSGEFSIQRSGWTEEYRILSPDFNIHEISQTINQTLHQTLDQDYQRLDDIIALIKTRSCITKKMLAGFGERLPHQCNTCSSCQKEPRPRQLPQTKIPELLPEQIELIQTVHNQAHPALKNPKTFTRFLCGIPSPRVRYHRLYRNEHHGALAKYDHEEVELQVQIRLGIR